MPKNKTQTKAQQRVAIAKDVLLQINLKKYTPSTGTYVATNDGNDGHTMNQGALRDKHAPACTVCAKGALCLSAIRKFNSYGGTAGKLGDDEGVMKVLKRFFGHRQTELIEAAFEEWGDEGQAAQNYRDKNNLFYDSKAIVAIMKNIIKNGGTFKP